MVHALLGDPGANTRLAGHPLPLPRAPVCPQQSPTVTVNTMLLARRPDYQIEVQLYIETIIGYI